MTVRNYSSTASTTELSAGVTDAATSLVVASTSGFPSTPYILAIDAGTTSQELVLVTGVAGTTLTVTRGYDSTSAVAHLAGATVQHSHAAIDFREANDHINDSTGVHGLTGDVVGTTDTQTLTNKTLTTPTLEGYTADKFVTTDSSGEIGASVKDIPSGAVVGTSDAQTLTNKTIALGSNTVSGTKAQFDAALTDANFATLAGVENLTNKTVSLALNTLSGNKAEFNGALTGDNFVMESDTSYIKAIVTAEKSTDTVVTTEALVLTTSFTAVSGAVYRISAMVEVSQDTSTARSDLWLKVDSASSGTTGTQVVETIKDHRQASRREGVAMWGLWTGDANATRHVKLTAASISGTTTVLGVNTPVRIMVERIS